MNQHKNTNPKLTYLVLLLTAAALIAFCLAQTTQGKSEYPRYWDSRLDALNVTYHPATDCSEGCWRVDSAIFEDVHESGGNHNVYGRLTIGGNSPAGLPWHVAYPGGNVRILTKAAPEWSDFPMFAEYDPDEGEAGPYYAYAGDSIATSDVVRGMGLPERQHVNFRLIWIWVPSGGTATPTPTPAHRLWLPIIQRN